MNFSLEGGFHRMLRELMKEKSADIITLYNPYRSIAGNEL